MSSYNKLSDSKLLHLLQEDDNLAYTEIFERYWQVLVNHAFKILGDKDEANDIVQEVFLAIWNRRHDLRVSGSFSAYMFKATKNKILNYIAHEKVVTKYAEGISKYIKEDYAYADYGVREKELQAIISKEIELLPEKMRKAFLLRKVEELSYQEIASQLNITDKTAKQQVYYALKKLKNKLKILTLFSVFFT